MIITIDWLLQLIDWLLQLIYWLIDGLLLLQLSWSYWHAWIQIIFLQWIIDSSVQQNVKSIILYHWKLNYNFNILQMKLILWQQQQQRVLLFRLQRLLIYRKTKSSGMQTFQLPAHLTAVLFFLKNVLIWEISTHSHVSGFHA